MWRLGNECSPVLFVLIETAEQFSSGEVILHVTGRLNWESGAKVLSSELQEFVVGHTSRTVMFVVPAIVKFWNNGSSDLLVVTFMELSTQHRRLARRICLLKAVALFEMTLFCGRSRYLLSSLFAGYLPLASLNACTA